jgi:hypothetical protein
MNCKLVRVSADAALASSTSTSDFWVSVGDQEGVRSVKRIALKSCIFANVFPNVSAASGNNTFYFSYNGIDYSFVLADGFYGAVDLAATLQAEILLASPIPSIVIQALPFTGKMSFDTTLSPFLFSINGSLSGGGGGPNNMSDLIGVPAGSTQSVTAGVLIPTDIVQLQGLTEVYVRSQTLSPAQCYSESKTVDNIAWNIPVTVPFLGINVWEAKDDSLVYVDYRNTRDLAMVDIQLVDRAGIPVALQGSNLKLTFLVWFSEDAAP